MPKTKKQREPKQVSLPKWLEQLKRMPDNTPFTFYFDFTLKRGWMRKNLKRLGWSVDIKTGKWTPPAEGAKP